MTSKPLELRGPLQVFIAYLVSPAVGLTGWWVVWRLSTGATAATNPKDNWGPLGGWLATMVIGMPVSLLVEFVLVTPVLVALERRRWRWMTGWTVSASGFLLGFAPYLAFAMFVGQGYLRYDPRGAVLSALAGGLAFGVVGLVSAMAFRVLAMRRTG